MKNTKAYQQARGKTDEAIRNQHNSGNSGDSVGLKDSRKNKFLAFQQRINTSYSNFDIDLGLLYLDEQCSD
jgi:hypothetical protein